MDAGVDVVVAGHVHDYERSLPIRHGAAVSDNYTRPAAPVYVIDGAGGNREGLQKSVVPEPWAPRSHPFNGVDVSYGVATVAGCSLRWQQFAAGNNSVLDDFTITKCPAHAARPVPAP